MLTVLMATYDGAETLPEVLEGWRRVVSPPGGWRLVVADDGSTDGSADLVAAAGAGLPLVLRRFPHRGQSATRNASLGDVEGDLVVLTDDDAVPAPDVLVRLREAAERHPEATVFAGTVRPRWRSVPPPWVLAWVRLAPTFAIREMPAGPIAADEPLGPCIAVRAAVFAQGVRFDESRGPDGTDDYPMGGETTFLLRVAERGHAAIGVPAAVVEHVILPHQTTEAWILDRAARYGRGHGNRDLPPRTPLERAAREAKHRLALAASFLTGDRRRRFKARWHLRYLDGLVRERRRLRRREAPA